MVNGDHVGATHFACHNTFTIDGGGSSIDMVGGPFVPDLLNEAAERRTMSSTNPLIFLNSCRTAGAAPQFMRTVGWADQFMAAGAGAFIGTLWPVRSSSASAFAEAFYRELIGGASLGAASRQARLSIRRDDDPTWLAYSVYGDPRAIAVTRAQHP